MANSYTKKLLGENYILYQQSRIKIYQYFYDKLQAEGSIMKSSDLQHMHLYDYTTPFLKHNYKTLFSSIIVKLKNRKLVSVKVDNFNGNTYTVIRSVPDPKRIIGTAEEIIGSVNFEQVYNANKQMLFDFTRAAALIMRSGDTVQITFLVASLDLPYSTDSTMRGMYYNYIAGYFRNKAEQGYFIVSGTADGKLTYTRTEKGW